MTQDPLAISADDILREGNVRGASPFETAAALQRWRSDVLNATRTGDGEQWANKVAKFDGEALSPVLEYLRSDALKQGANPEDVKNDPAMWTPAIQRLKAPIVAGGQQIGSFDLVMGDSPTAIAYSFNGPGNERVAIPLPKPTSEAIQSRAEELAKQAAEARANIARAQAELAKPDLGITDRQQAGSMSNARQQAKDSYEAMVTDNVRKERETLLRLDGIKANPQLGFLSDQLEQQITTTDLNKKFGGVHLGEDFMRGLTSFYVGARVTWNDLTGDTAERREWEKIHGQLGDIMPGTNRSLTGTVGNLSSALAETAGGQAPSLALMAATSGMSAPVAAAGSAAGLGAMGVTSYGSTRADSANQVEYLRRQAELLKQAGHDSAAADTLAEADKVEKSAVPRALGTAIAEVATEKMFAEEKLFAGGISRGWRDLGRKTLTSGWQNAVEEASAQVIQGNIIDPASGLQQGTAGDVAQAATVGALFGGALTGLRGIRRAFNKGDWATPPAEGPRQAATPPVEPPPPAPEPEAQGAPDPAAAQRQRAQAAAQAAAPDPATKQAVEQIFATAEAAAKGDPIPVAETTREEVPHGQEENRQGQGRQEGLLSPEPPSDSWKEPILRIAKENPNAENDFVEKLQEHLDSGKPLAYGRSGDGTLTVGYDVLDKAHAKIELTPEENKSFKMAEADETLADTPEERNDAKKRQQAILKTAAERLLTPKNGNADTRPTEPVVENAAETTPAVAPISEQPSENLAPRSTQTVEPRPERQGRDTSARDAWDEKYGTQVRGGRTHNDDGTPYQPTVFDETVPKIIDALSGKTFDEKLDAVGTDTGAELGTGVRQLLNDGWVWDNTQGRMVDPKNRGETPRQALNRIERQRQGQGQGQGRNEGLLSPEPPAQNNEPVPSGQTQDGLEVPSLPGEATGTGSSASVSEPSVTPEAETVNSENITRTGISIPPELTNSVAPIQGLKSSDPNILRLEPGLAYRTVSRAEVASLVTEGYHLPDPNLQGRKKKSRGQTTKKMWSRLNEANPEIGYKPGSIVMVARESDIPQQTKGRATPVDAIKIAQFQNGAWQLTTPAEFLKEEDAVNSENGTTPPEESPTTVTDLARSTVKASRNVDPEEASVNSEKPPLYWKGDQIELTGRVTPDGFEEFRYVDGAKAGQLGVRMTQKERAATTEERQAQFQREQEDFRRLREIQQEPKPTTVTDLATSTRKAARNVDPEAFKQRVAEEAAPVSEQPKAPRRWRAPSRESELFRQAPFANHIITQTPMLSRSKAMARGREFWERVKPFYDSAPRLSHPTHNAIYGGTSTPDQVAKALQEEGLLPDGDVETMWRQLANESAGAVSVARQERAENRSREAEEKQQRQQDKAFSKATKAGAEQVLVDDLYVGQEVVIEGEKMKVADVVTDEDGYVKTVVLEDGSKFGRQILDNGERIFVESVSEAPDVAFGPEDDFGLQTQTEADVRAEQKAAEERRKRYAQAEEMAARMARPMSGNSTNVGQGTLFSEDEDLFSGPSAQRAAAQPSAIDRAKEAGRDPSKWSDTQRTDFEAAFRGDAEAFQRLGRIQQSAFRGIATEDEWRAVGGSPLKGGPGASSLEEWGPTRFGERLAIASPDMKGAWAQEFQPTQYRKRTEAEWEADSRRFIQEHGLGAASLVFDQESGLDGSDRVALAGLLLDEADRAAAKGNQEANDLTSDLADWLSLNGSKAGQEVRAYGFLVNRDPRLILEHARKTRSDELEKGAAKDLGVPGEQAQQEVKAIAAEEREAATADEEKRLDPSVEQAETEAAAERKKAEQDADDAMQKRAEEMLAKYARSQSDTLSWGTKGVPDPLRQLMAEHIKKRVPDFVERAMALGVDQVTAERLMQVGTEETRRIEGIKTAARLERAAIADQQEAERIVDGLAREFSDTLPPAKSPTKSALRELVAKAKRAVVADLAAKFVALRMKPETARQLVGLLDEYRRREAAVKEAKKRLQQLDQPENTAVRTINRFAREFSDTPTKPSGKQDAVRTLVHDTLRAEAMPDDLAAKFVALGVKPATAARLVRLLETARARAAEVAREKAGQRLIDSFKPRATIKAAKRLPKLIVKLLDAEKNGVLHRTEFLEAYAEAFDLPVMTSAHQERLTKLAQEARLLPEGLPRAEKIHELQDALAIFAGVKARDALLSAWYANFLSGISTQAVNIWGNVWYLVIRGSAAAIASPKDAMSFASGLLRGADRGLLEAKAALRGERRLKGGEKFGDVSVLEILALMPWKEKTIGQKLGTLLSVGPVGRYVFRSLAAADGFFHGVALEGRAHLAASRAVRGKGLKPGSRAFYDAVADDLGLGKERWEAAFQQAKEEAIAGKKSGDWVKRRVWDIVDRARSDDVREEARNWSEIVTFTNDPTGSMGAVNWVFQFLMKLESTHLSVPIVRPIIPFARIMANVMSAGFDLTPIGILRGLAGRNLVRFKPELQQWDARERLVMGIMGSAVMTLVGALAWKHKDEDDKDSDFMIYGAGPPDKARREQMPIGWKPYTIKIRGKYLSYAETPLGIGLAVVGSVMDAVRYTKDFDEKDIESRMGYVLKSSMKSVFTQGMLSSAGNLIDTIKGERPVASLFSTYFGGLVPMRGLLRDISYIFDPTKVAVTDVRSAMVRDIPVVRNLGAKPALNVWGEPVSIEGAPVLRRFITSQRPHDLSDWMTRNGLKVPSMPLSIEWASYLTAGEKPSAKANRVEGGMLTNEERYQFGKRAGELLKTKVSKFKNEDIPAAAERGTIYPQAYLQKRVTALVQESRREAMRELVTGPEK